MTTTTTAACPSAIARVWGLGYIYALQKTGPLVVVSDWWRLIILIIKPEAWWWVSPCMILQLCMLGILSLHLPALWSERVNRRTCVTQLEKTALYFAVLQGLMLMGWGNGSATEYTCAALCLGWYVGQSRKKREWMSAPERMQYLLGVYFLGCVPILWLWMEDKGPYDNSSSVWVYVLCDISLVCLECALQVYARLGELCVAATTTSP